MARAMKHRSDAWDKEQSAFAKELGNIETMARMLGTPGAVKEGRVQAAYEQHQVRIRALDENEG